jgi:hypothetical protein
MKYQDCRYVVKLRLVIYYVYIEEVYAFVNIILQERITFESDAFRALCRAEEVERQCLFKSVDITIILLLFNTDIVLYVERI